jgi:TPP-dependent pyruvate/acetoin dehydrogenase alpha subunit
MTEETQQQARRDPLVEHVVPLLAKAMATTQDTEELWTYLHERVQSECRRMEDDAVREALEPLQDRYSIETLARVAASMAQQAVVSEAQVA